MLAVAAIGGGVEDSSRRRSSAAEIDEVGSIGGFGLDIREGSYLVFPLTQTIIRYH